MRTILLVTQHLNRGGVETHVASLARQLLADGHRVVLASGWVAGELNAPS